jgi:hypothetical protein
MEKFNRAKTIEISKNKLHSHMASIQKEQPINYLDIINSSQTEKPATIEKTTYQDITHPPKPKMDFDLFNLQPTPKVKSVPTIEQTQTQTPAPQPMQPMQPMQPVQSQQPIQHYQPKHNTSSIKNVMDEPRQQYVAPQPTPQFYGQPQVAPQGNVFVPRHDQLESTQVKNLPDFLNKMSSKVKIQNILSILFFTIVFLSSLSSLVIIGVNNAA